MAALIQDVSKCKKKMQMKKNNNKMIFFYVLGYNEAGFLAALSSHVSGRSSINNSSSAIKFDRIIYDPGKNYNSGEGVFRVPHSGMYHIFCQLYGNIQKSLQYYLRVNGTATAYTYEYAASSSTHRSATFSIVFSIV